MSYQSLVLLAASAIGLAAFAWLVLRARRYLELRRFRRRMRRGAEGQREARDYLRRRGFEVLAEEHELPGVIEVDGEPLHYAVRVDFLVRRGRRVHGVEVKTGSMATDPLHRPTRRQLLEYSHLLDVDGLYLLDMDTPRLMRVRFGDADQGRRRGWAWPVLLIVGFALGAAAASLLLGGGRWP